MQNVPWGRRVFIPMAVAFVMLAAWGCGGGKTEAPSTKTSETVEQAKSKVITEYPLSVRDDLGREVVLPARPERILSLAPSNTEILFALELGDRVVGVTDYCDYPQDVEGKERVGGFQDPNIEKIVSLSPDLILATGGIQAATVDQLAGLGIPVYVIDPHTVDESLEGILTVGKLAGVAGKADELHGRLNARVRAVTDKLADLPGEARPRVFYEVWPKEPLMTAGPGSFADDMITLAGGQNVAAETGEPYPQFSEEVLVAGDPEVIITPFQETLDSLTKGDRTAWNGIDAVANGRVFVVDQNLVSRPGPRIIDGLEAFARAIHPGILGP